jgi:hypothetical protein
MVITDAGKALPGNGWTQEAGSGDPPFSAEGRQVLAKSPGIRAGGRDEPGQGGGSVTGAISPGPLGDGKSGPGQSEGLLGEKDMGPGENGGRLGEREVGPGGMARGRDSIRVGVVSFVDSRGGAEMVPLNGSHARALDPGRWSRSWTEVKDAAEPGEAPAGTHEESVPIWIADRPWGAGERARLRRLIQQRYDTHARTVARVIAEEPGLLAGQPQAELITDLVALRAYHVDDHESINAALRGAEASERELLLARGAIQGLTRLPSVLGAVFAVSVAPATGYLPGDELIEPSFVDVSLARAGAPEVRTEFAIWSVSAHRLDATAPAAVFPPGSRFSVLAVDPPPSAGEPSRVLLLDRADNRPIRSEHHERLCTRLRTLLDLPVSETSARPLPFAPGLDARGRRFTPPRLAGKTSEGL